MTSSHTPSSHSTMFTADFFRHLDTMGQGAAVQAQQQQQQQQQQHATPTPPPAQDIAMDYHDAASYAASPSSLFLPSVISGDTSKQHPTSNHNARPRTLTGEARKVQQSSILDKWRHTLGRNSIWQGRSAAVEDTDDSAPPSLTSSSSTSTTPLESPVFTSASSLVSTVTSSYFPATRAPETQDRSATFLRICSLVTDTTPKPPNVDTVAVSRPGPERKRSVTAESPPSRTVRAASPIVAQTYEVEAMDPNSRHVSLRRSSDPANALSRTPAKFADDVKPAYTITNEIVLNPRPTDEGSHDPIPYPGSSDESVRCLRHVHAPPADLIASGEAVSVSPPPQGAYAPHWTRYALKDKQGWCGICPEGSWYSMKRSQYMYHLQFEHGISSRTSTFFAPPTHLLKWNDMNSTTEGMCGQCRCWIPICFGPVRRISFMAWFKHASKCSKRAGAAGTAGAEDDAEDA